MSSSKITARIESEIQRLSSEHGYSDSILREFALFVLTKESAKAKPAAKPKPPKVKKLNNTQIKQAIYDHFGVKDTGALKKSGSYQIATSAMGSINLSKREDLERIYRKFIGILPGEENEEGYGCVNSINIFKYDMPWKAFGLDPKVNSTEDVKAAYRNLSKIYHPDNSETGDPKVFDRLTVFYKSLTEKF